jgi:hypothetical protein
VFTDLIAGWHLSDLHHLLKSNDRNPRRPLHMRLTIQHSCQLARSPPGQSLEPGGVWYRRLWRLSFRRWCRHALLLCNPCKAHRRALGAHQVDPSDRSELPVCVHDVIAATHWRRWPTHARLAQPAA